MFPSHTDCIGSVAPFLLILLIPSIQANSPCSYNDYPFPDTKTLAYSIEGRNDEELPEVLLGGCRVMEFDLNKVGSAPGSEKEELLENGIAATDSWS